MKLWSVLFIVIGNVASIYILNHRLIQDKSKPLSIQFFTNKSSANTEFRLELNEKCNVLPVSVHTDGRFLMFVDSSHIPNYFKLESVNNFDQTLCGTYTCIDLDTGINDSVSVSLKDFDNDTFNIYEGDQAVFITTSCSFGATLSDMKSSWFIEDSNISINSRAIGFIKTDYCANATCDGSRAQRFTFGLNFTKQDEHFTNASVRVNIVHPLFSLRPLIWRSSKKFPVKESNDELDTHRFTSATGTIYEYVIVHLVLLSTLIIFHLSTRTTPRRYREKKKKAAYYTEASQYEETAKLEKQTLDLARLNNDDLTMTRQQVMTKFDKEHSISQSEMWRQQQELQKKWANLIRELQLPNYGKIAKFSSTDERTARLNNDYLTMIRQQAMSQSEMWRQQQELQKKCANLIRELQLQNYGKIAKLSSPDERTARLRNDDLTMTRPQVMTKSDKEHGISQSEMWRQQHELQKKRAIVIRKTELPNYGKNAQFSRTDERTETETDTATKNKNEPRQQEEKPTFTSDSLDALCYIYGRKSNKVRELCEAIIAQTKNRLETTPEYIDIVADIYPSYTPETPNRIIFVITLKRHVDESLLKAHIPFATELRVLGCYSDEAKYVYNSEIVEPMSVKDQLKAKQCINMNCEELFKRHRYLSIITANNKRSRGFKTDNHIIDKRLCLVLFVHAKGFIPIDEEQFSSMDAEFDIDVLEGVFTPYVKDCQEYHADVKMGCMISRSDNVVGTLGGFIDHHKHGLVGLTCAHVLLNETEFNRCKDHGENLGLDKWPDEYRDVEKRHVFQPNTTHKHPEIGQIVEAVYCPGGDNRSGIDAVLFKVESRFPSSGSCPSVSRDGENIVPACSFETGKICGPMSFHDNTVTKFGAETELTKGLLEFEVPFVCVKTVDPVLIGGPFSIKLFHQYQVRALPVGSLFSSYGDSGALVLAEDLDKKKVCIGILEGGQEKSQLTIVTPIQDVLEQFKIRNFKQFENEENAKRLVEMVSTVTEMKKKVDSLSAMQSTVNRIEESQKRIEQFINGNNSQNQQNV